MINNITMIHLDLINELLMASEKLHKYIPIFIQCPIFGYQTSLLNVRQKGDFVYFIDKIDGYLKIALSIYVCEVTSPMSPAQKSSLTKTKSKMEIEFRYLDFRSIIQSVV